MPTLKDCVNLFTDLQAYLQANPNEQESFKATVDKLDTFLMICQTDPKYSFDKVGIKYSLLHEYLWEHAQELLFFALSKGHCNRSLVELLIYHGANVELTSNDEHNHTAIHLATIHRCWRVVRFLVSQFSFLALAQNAKGYTALHIAAIQNDFLIAELLLDHLYNHGIVDKEGNTPFFLAARHGSLSVLQLLTKKCQININTTDSSGNTAWHYAAINNYKVIMDWLLTQTDVDINAKNSVGDTALHYAAEEGYVEIATALVGRGADITIKNKNGQCAADLVKNNQDLQKLLTPLSIVSSNVRLFKRNRTAEGMLLASQNEAKITRQR
jgi:ankyrin repeat protein